MEYGSISKSYFINEQLICMQAFKITNYELKQILITFNLYEIDRTDVNHEILKISIDFFVSPIVTK